MKESNSYTPLKIIAVEDSAVIVERIQLLLSEMDNVEFLGAASTISKALYLINEHKPDVVILDIHLDKEVPAANGIDLLIELKRKYPNIRVIMFTGLNELQYRISCMAYGADYYFIKSRDFSKIPIALESLREQINTRFSKK